MHPAIFCLMCGLPGSGKSTICQSVILSKKKDFQVFTISYDIITEMIGKAGVGTLITELEAWRMTRKTAIDVARCMIDDLFYKEASDQLRLILDACCGKPWTSISESHGVEAKLRVVLIDDNFHFPSMRQDYFNLVRDCNRSLKTRCYVDGSADENSIIYCQVLIDTPLHICLDRNMRRVRDLLDEKIAMSSSHKIITDDIILKMHSAFQFPAASIIFNCKGLDKGRSCSHDEISDDSIKLINLSKPRYWEKHVPSFILRNLPDSVLIPTSTSEPSEPATKISVETSVGEDGVTEMPSVVDLIFEICQEASKVYKCSPPTTAVIASDEDIATGKKFKELHQLETLHSFLHQMDIMLRKSIGTYMSAIKESAGGAKASAAKILNDLRKEHLETLRAKNSEIPISFGEEFNSMIDEETNIFHDTCSRALIS